MAPSLTSARDLVHEDEDPRGDAVRLSAAELVTAPNLRGLRRSGLARPAPLVRAAAGAVRGAAVPPVVTVQCGHCFRKSGATGTHREQEAAAAIGAALAARLTAHGYRVHLIGADDRIPESDFFVALHTDGSSSPVRKGGSVGYRDKAGAQYAAAWKRAHQANGYPHGFHADNYTAALRNYYGVRRSTARFRFIAEHAFTTSPVDCGWLFDNIGACAQAHVDAIGAVRGGHPHGAAPPPPADRPVPRPAPPFPLRRGAYFGPEGGGPSSVSGYHSHREDLRAWQRRMAERGWRITADGLYGPRGARRPEGQTADVARAFQREKGLTADALIGPDTWSAAWTAPLA